jgi:predicted RNase H-like HicB family nuclease
MRYKVVLQRSDEGFSVHCPGLPGCWAQGATEEEALETVREAIQEYLATVDELVEGKEVRQVEVAA